MNTYHQKPASFQFFLGDGTSQLNLYFAPFREVVIE